MMRKGKQCRRRQTAWRGRVCFLPTGFLLLVSHAGCGGRIGPGQDDTSDGGTTLGGEGHVSCEYPVTVETYTVEPSPQRREATDSVQVCLQSAHVLGPRSDIFGVNTHVLCVEVQPGTSAAVSLPLELSGGEPLTGLEYSLVSGASHIEFFIEHDKGTLTCPTLYQDNAVNLENGTATCAILEAGGSHTLEYCPCTGVVPDAPSSIQWLRWEAVQDDESAPFSGQLCLGRQVHLCTGDCQSWFRLP